MSEVILGATAWTDNGYMMRDVFRLLEHQLDLAPDPVDLHLDGTEPPRRRPHVYDLTYGAGVWWNQLGDEVFVEHGAIADFTRMTEMEFDLSRDGFDVVAFDPPYVLQGGEPRGSEGFADQQRKFRERYGIDKPRNINELKQLIFDGLATARTLTKAKGFVLVKSMPFVTSGKVHFIPDDITEWMRAAGWTKFDELIFLKAPGPQPNHQRQLQARRNYSVLQIWRAPA